MTAPTQAERVLALVRQKGIVRGAEFDRLGIHCMHLKRLADRGLLVQRSRGVYEAAKPRMSEYDSLIEVAARVPKATLCLLTALRLHGLTTQNPFEVWIMIDRKARKPSIDSPPVHVVRASGAALTGGFEPMKIDGVEIKVTTVAKTVDFLGYGDPSPDGVADAVRVIVSVESDDGIRFAPESITAEEIRETQDYDGVRVADEARRCADGVARGDRDHPAACAVGAGVGDRDDTSARAMDPGIGLEHQTLIAFGRRLRRPRVPNRLKRLGYPTRSPHNWVFLLRSVK